MGYICVVGGANIDITGKSYSEISLADSNPGKLSITLGGVGRNIAENLARLDNNVKMLTVLGTDVYSELIRHNAQEVGIDLTDSLTVDGANSSTYLCLTNRDGEMFVGLSDMGILDSLTPEYLNTKLGLLNNADCVVCDTNVPECLLWLCDNVRVPIFVDTVSAKKTKLIASGIHNVFCIKPNIYEAEVLSGVTINNDADMQEAIDRIHAKGISWVIVTCGQNGVVYSDGKTFGRMSSMADKVVNTTGAGDSFVAGLVSGFVKGHNIEQCVMYASAASSITLATDSTVSTEMSDAAVKKIILKVGR